MDYEDILYQLRQDLISIQFNSLPEFVFLKQALECEGFRLSNNRSYSDSGYFEKFSKFSNSSMLTTVYSPIRKIVTYEQFRESRSKKQGGGKDMKFDEIKEYLEDTLNRSLEENELLIAIAVYLKLKED